MQLIAIPLKNAGRAEGDEPWQKPQAEMQAEPLHDDGGDEGGEDNGHRHAIPQETSIVRREMVVRRTKGGEKKADKNTEIGPALSRVDENLLRRVAGFAQKYHAH